MVINLESLFSKESLTFSSNFSKQQESNSFSILLLIYALQFFTNTFVNNHDYPRSASNQLQRSEHYPYVSIEQSQLDLGDGEIPRQGGINHRDHWLRRASEEHGRRRERGGGGACNAARFSAGKFLYRRLLRAADAGPTSRVIRTAIFHHACADPW